VKLHVPTLKPSKCTSKKELLILWKGEDGSRETGTIKLEIVSTSFSTPHKRAFYFDSHNT
jgi:hypothetical protein